ncbi:MAG: AAA family ATPase [Desulfamplus sp.]|nr:AAA family ATPase [Desulfamplus sp.]
MHQVLKSRTLAERTQYTTQVSKFNNMISDNLYLIVGDELLELQSSRVYGATNPGPQDAWRIVHIWIRDLITDIKRAWNQEDICIFIDCNPSFTIYTELALTASERLLVPFSADGSSQRAVKTVLSLVYGVRRHQVEPQSDFFLNSQRYRMSLPQIYMYIGNRLTQMNSSSASAFKTIVNEIGEEIWNVWKSNPASFYIHPAGVSAPINKRFFKNMFQYEVNDANTASVVSGALGIPISRMTAGKKDVAGKKVTVNQSQLDKQVPNIQDLVKNIE